tara:strand:- start:446 stop:1000 length:555 start_codon:yes stop_codon:yes gene_type:complete
MTDAVRSTTEATLRQAQSLSVPDQLWLIEKLAGALSLAELFCGTPPKTETPTFNAVHHHSIVEFDELKLCILDMSTLDHGANTILVPGNVEVSDTHRVTREKRTLPYTATGCHTALLSTFVQGEEFTDALARFQNNPDFGDIEDPATTIIWLRRNIDGRTVPSEPAAESGDDAVPEPPEGGAER